MISKKERFVSDLMLLKEQFDEAKKKHKVVKSKAKRSVREEDTGFCKTRKIYCQSCKRKFTYRYRWFDIDEDRYKVLTCVDFQGLRDKVKDNGLKWEISNYSQARKTAKEVGLPLVDLK